MLELLLHISGIHFGLWGPSHAAAGCLENACIEFAGKGQGSGKAVLMESGLRYSPVKLLFLTYEDTLKSQEPIVEIHFRLGCGTWLSGLQV